MKNFQSTIEGTWIEKIPVTLTEQEQTLLSSKEESEEKNQLLSDIKSRCKVSVVSPKLEVLTGFYTKVKNSLRLKETDSFEFILFNLTEKDNGGFSGMLNYRVNNEHTQKRFK